MPVTTARVLITHRMSLLQLGQSQCAVETPFSSGGGGGERLSE